MITRAEAEDLIARESLALDRCDWDSWLARLQLGMERDA